MAAISYRPCWKSLGCVCALLLSGALGTARAADAPAGALQLTVHHITAAVVDMDRAVKWYRDVLGLRVDQRGSRMEGKMQFAELSVPGFGVALIQLPPGTAQPRGAGELTPSWVHIVFTVPDVKSAFALLRGRGADVHTRDQSPVTDSFLLHDSEGNEIEILQAARH